jgi:CubicO group peptidase (beta-lactamase class C family)
MIKNLIFLNASFLLISSIYSNAQPAEVTPRRAAGDMATEFKNYRIAPGTFPSPLPKREPQGKEIDIVLQAQTIANNNPLLSIVLVDKGEIIFEAYNAPAREDRPNFSWSMSKSLTAYTMGLANCETPSIDYNQPAEIYSDDLKGTVYGEATVQNLLTMSSGVRKAISSGDHLFKKDSCTKGIDCDGWEMGRSQKLSGVEYLRKVNERDIASGKEFRYSGTDTLALSNIIDKNGGFIKQFEQHIWNNIGAESAGFWLLDKDNKVIAQAGFSAVSRDWARLAMYTIKLKKSGTACQQQFMNDATRPQITNNGSVGRLHRAYGYQTWINSNGPRISYWWLGFGGQRVAIDPEKERILVVTSFRESYMDLVGDLFSKWQRN